MAGPGGRFRLELDLGISGAGLLARLAWVAGLPETSPVRHEMEGYLYMTLARHSWRRADELRAAARDRDRRRARRGTTD